MNSYHNLKPSDRKWMEDFDRKAKLYHRFSPRALQRRRDLQRAMENGGTHRANAIRLAQQREDSEDAAAEVAKRHFKRVHCRPVTMEEADDRFSRMPVLDLDDPLASLVAAMPTGQLMDLYGALGEYLAENSF